jgi:hypothetical protein
MNIKINNDGLWEVFDADGNLRGTFTEIADAELFEAAIE